MRLKLLGLVGLLVLGAGCEETVATAAYDAATGDASAGGAGDGGAPDGAAPDALALLGDGAPADGGGAAWLVREGLEPMTCPFAIPAGLQVACGFVTVPENRAAPAGAKVRLAVAAVKSRAAQPAPTPAVYLEGGPGGSGLQTLGALLSMGLGPFGAVIEDRDLIVFDQRGTGASKPSLACPELRIPPGMMDMMPMAGMLPAGVRAQLTACRDRLRAVPVDFGQYTTVASADDVEDLRRVLGYERWDLLGVSYGTRLGLEVMRRHPENVRAVVLDSLVPPQVDLLAQIPANMNRALELVWTRCSAQPTCEKAYPGLRQVLVTALDKLAAQPVTLMVGTQPVRLDAQLAMRVIGALLYNPATVAVVPELIFQLRDGSAALVVNVLAALGGVGISEGVNINITCAEEAPFTTPAAFAAVLEGVGGDLRPYFGGSDVFDVCSVWGAPAAPASANEAITSTLPTLLLSGEIDPVTPPAWGALVHETLSKSELYVLTGLGHATITDPCGGQLVREFLAKPEARPTNACVDKLAPQPLAILRL